MSTKIDNAKISLEAAAQEVADLLPDHIKVNKSSIGVQFPYGVIRPLNEHFDRWPYLSIKRRRTVACTIQLCDVNRWHLNTWKLGLTAGSMWAWHCTLPVIAVIETLMYEFGLQHGLIAERTKFRKMIDTFQSKGVISASLREGLHDLREYRNRIHIYLQEDVQMHDGKPRLYNDAVRALRKLEKALKRYWKNNC